MKVERAAEDDDVIARLLCLPVLKQRSRSRHCHDAGCCLKKMQQRCHVHKGPKRMVKWRQENDEREGRLRSRWTGRRRIDPDCNCKKTPCLRPYNSPDSWTSRSRGVPPPYVVRLPACAGVGELTPALLG
ncbi:hypothetical protein B0H14DRAFT_2567413 [Mycena olivaceomarginata]|nr:hypothetical protein B0H14DRAFT_2567413 [Mycena olivaceomarginata]